MLSENFDRDHFLNLKFHCFSPELSMNFENHLTTRKQFRERITYQGVDLVVSKTFETFEWRFLSLSRKLRACSTKTVCAVNF